MKKTTTSGLKLLLKSQKMKQKDLAELLNVSQGMVSQWATGRIKMDAKTQSKILHVIEERNAKEGVKVTDTYMSVNTNAVTVSESSSNALTLEEKINSCKKYCLDTYGFEVIVVK